MEHELLNYNKDTISEFKSIVFAPFLDYLHEIFCLRVASVLEKLDNFDKSLFAFCSSDNCLQNTKGSTALTIKEFRV